jgi:protein-L-isoaspartate O-methyltransferase
VKNPDSDAPVAQAHRAARLTQALTLLADEHSRECGLSGVMVVAAIATALGYVAAVVARSNAYAVEPYGAFVAKHFLQVLNDEFERPILH